jgi:tetratricopeptide (TPR) repeat protein
MMCGRSFLKFADILFLAACILWGSSQQLLRGQSTSTTTSSTTASPSEEKLYFFGMVVQDDGSPPPVGTAIELDCSDTLTRVADVDLTGQYTFLLGDSERLKQLHPDASIGTTDPFSSETSASGGSSSQTQSASTSQSTTQSTTQTTTIPTTRVKLAACELRALFSGYRSTTVKFAGMAFSSVNTVGAIVIYPVNKFRGTAVSATSLNAPKKAKKLVDQAIKAYTKDNLRESESLLKSAIAEYPQYGEAWFQLGMVYQKLQRVSDARNSLKKAIEIDSLYVNPYVQLAWVAAREGKWQEAADITEKEIALDPILFPEALYINAMANFNLNQMELAEKRARQMQRLDPDHKFPRNYLTLAHIASAKKDPASAAENFRNYLKYAPNASDADAVRKQLQENEKLAKTGAGK